MHRLTARRFAAARALLDQSRQELFTSFGFHTGNLDKELRAHWHVKDQELKEIMRDLLNDDRYREVIAYWMEHRNTAGVDQEFEQPLAEVYGAESWFDLDLEQKRKAYWEGAFQTPSS
jgi:hypothetical protein